MGKKKEEQPAAPAQPVTEAKPVPAEVKQPAPVVESKPVTETKPAAVVEKPATVKTPVATAEKPKATKLEVPASNTTTIKAVLDQSSQIKVIMEITSFLVDEIEFMFDDKGLHFRAIDASHVGAIFVDLYPTMFMEYKATGPISFTINAQDVIKIIRRAKATDTVSFMFSSKEKHIFAIGMVSVKTNRTFKLKIKDALLGEKTDDIASFVESFQKLIKEKTQASFGVDIKTIAEMIQDAGVTSELLKLGADLATRSINISTADESGEYTADLQETSLKDLEVKGNASGIYSINFLEGILKMANVCETMKLSFFNASPVFIEFKLLRNTTEEGIMYYLLAPRVEDLGNEGDIFDTDEEEEEVKVPDTHDDESGEDEPEG
jgi:DNA polymerase III sliding clamp (beta) subunit (PCNA family)